MVMYKDIGYTYTLRTYEDEILGLIDHTKVDAALARSSEQEMIGDISFVIEDAIRSSSICWYSGVLHYFNGFYYVPLPVVKNDITSTIISIMRKLGVHNSAIVYRGRFVARIAKLAITGMEVTPDKGKICFDNGVLDLDTNEFMDFSPKHYVFGSTGYIYNRELRANTDAYHWTRFLDKVLPEKSSQLLLQEFLGMVFLDRRKLKIDCMLFLIGRGANGKSVVFNTIMGVLGRENVTNFDIPALTVRKDATHNIAEINGKRLNYCSEISSKDINSEQFKSLVSGEPTPARRLWGQPFMAHEIPFFIGNGNRMPESSDISYGFFRRLLIIPFNVTIPRDKQDKELSYKLVAEYPAIFNWLIEGRDRVIRNGYRLSPSIASERALNEYQMQSNNINQFIEAYNLFNVPTNNDDVGVELSAKELYRTYCKWCEDNFEPTKNNTAFGRFLADFPFAKIRYSNGIHYRVFNANPFDFGLKIDDNRAIRWEQRQIKNNNPNEKFNKIDI